MNKSLITLIILLVLSIVPVNAETDSRIVVKWLTTRNQIAVIDLHTLHFYTPELQPVESFTLVNDSNSHIFIRDALWSRDEQRLALLVEFPSRMELQIWDVPNRQLLSVIDRHPGGYPGDIDIRAFTLSPDSQTVAISTIRPENAQSLVRFFNTSTGTWVRDIVLESYDPSAMAWYYPNQILMSRYDLEAWDLAAQPPSRLQTIGVVGGYPACYSPTGDRFAYRPYIDGVDTIIEIRSATTFQLLQSLQHSHRITDYQWTTSGISSVDARGTTSVWDPNTGSLIASFNTGRLDWVELSPDGRQLLTLTQAGEIIVRDAATGDILARLCRECINPVTVATTAGTASGTTVIPGSLRDILSSPQCKIACWQDIEPGVTTQAAVQTILHNLGIVYDVAILPDMTEADGGSYIWQADMGQFLMIHNQFASGMTFQGGIMVHMSLALDAPVNTVLHHYGLPDAVYQSSFGEDMALIYFDEGLYFGVHDTDRTLIDALIMTTPDNLNRGFGDVPPFKLANCDEPAVLCAILRGNPLPPPAPTATFTPVPTTHFVMPYGTLRSYFNPPECASFCWQGIEIGKTTQAEVDVILAQHGVEPAIYSPHTDNSDPIYSFTPGLAQFMLLHTHYGVTIHLSDGVVSQMTLPIFGDVDVVLADYGVPDRVIEDSAVRIIYQSQGLAFKVAGDDPLQVDHVLVAAPEKIAELYGSNDVTVENLQPCTEPANLCRIVTATPRP